MNDYQGLNLPQLMELLHGPVITGPTPWIPQTTGWLTLSGWLLGIIMIAARELLLQRRRNRYRRESLAALKKLAGRLEDEPTGIALQIGLLLKKTALHAYPRATVASLTGEDWAVFLRHSSNDDPLVSAAAEDLVRAAYHADVNPRELLLPAQRWIEKHRA